MPSRPQSPAERGCCEPLRSTRVAWCAMDAGGAHTLVREDTAAVLAWSAVRSSVGAQRGMVSGPGLASLLLLIALVLLCVGLARGPDVSDTDGGVRSETNETIAYAVCVLALAIALDRGASLQGGAAFSRDRAPLRGHRTARLPHGRRVRVPCGAGPTRALHLRERIEAGMSPSWLTPASWGSQGLAGHLA